MLNNCRTSQNEEMLCHHSCLQIFSRLYQKNKVLSFHLNLTLYFLNEQAGHDGDRGNLKSDKSLFHCSLNIARQTQFNSATRGATCNADCNELPANLQAMWCYQLWCITEWMNSKITDASVPASALISTRRVVVFIKLGQEQIKKKKTVKLHTIHSI